MENKEQVGLSDLQLVCYLVYKGFSIIDIENNGGKATFFFEKTVELKTTSDNYWNKDVEVELKRFNDIVRQVKSRLYNS